MKRKIILYASALIIIIGATPYVTGYFVESKFQKLAKVASEFDSMDVQVLEYKRGWRKSTAKTRITLQHSIYQNFMKAVDQDANPSNPITVVMEHEIRHGPFVQLQDNNYGNWIFALASFRSLSPESIKINGQINIGGSVKATMDVKPLKIFKGLHGEWSVTRDFKHLQIEAMTPGIDLHWEQNAKNKHFSADDIVFKTALERSIEGLWLGKTTINLQTMKINDNEIPVVDLQSVVVNNISTIKAGMIEGSAQINIQKLIEANESYGPVELAISVKNIDPKVVKLIIDNSKKTLMTSDSLVLGQMTETVLPQLLKGRPEFNIDKLSVVTPQGEFKGLLHLTLGGPTAFEFKDMSKIMQSIAGSFSAWVPKPLFREVLTNAALTRAQTQNAIAQSNQQKVLTEPEIAAMVKQEVDASINDLLTEGTFLEKENNYVIEISVQEGVFTVNGKKMGVPMPPPPVTAVPATP